MRTFLTITIDHLHFASAMLNRHGIITPPHLEGAFLSCLAVPCTFLDAFSTNSTPPPAPPTLQHTDSKGRASQVLAVSSPSGKRPPSSGQGSAAPRPGSGPGQAADRPRSSQVVLLSSTKQADQASVPVGGRALGWQSAKCRRELDCWCCSLLPSRRIRRQCRWVTWESRGVSGKGLGCQSADVGWAVGAAVFYQAGGSGAGGSALGRFICGKISECQSADVPCASQWNVIGVACGFTQGGRVGRPQLLSPHALQHDPAMQAFLGPRSVFSSPGLNREGAQDPRPNWAAVL